MLIVLYLQSHYLRAVKWNSAFSLPTHFSTQPRTESRVLCGHIYLVGQLFLLLWFIFWKAYLSIKQPLTHVGNNTCETYPGLIGLAH
jgi:hypothetical protein